MQLQPIAYNELGDSVGGARFVKGTRVNGDKWVPPADRQLFGDLIGCVNHFDGFSIADPGNVMGRDGLL